MFRASVDTVLYALHILIATCLWIVWNILTLFCLSIALTHTEEAYVISGIIAYL